MDWISVLAGCSAASDAITYTSLALTEFVRDVRECRAECDAISTELHSFDGILALLRYDAASFPGPLAEQTPAVLSTCLGLVDELGDCVSVLNQPGLSKAEKKARWLASRYRVSDLRWTMGEYKLALGLAVDLVGLIKAQSSRRDAPGGPEPRSESDDNLDCDLATVAARITDITSILQKDLGQNGALLKLGQYLHVLQREAVSAVNRNRPSQIGHRRDGCSSLDGPPDSAIDVTYDDMEAAFLKRRTTPRPRSASFDAWETEIDEFVGELSEMPAPAPPLPVRSASRRGYSPANHTLSQRPSTSDGCADTTRAANPTASRSSSMHPAFSAPHRPTQPFCTPVTELPEDPSQPTTRTHSRRSSIFGQVRFTIREPPRAQASDDLTAPAVEDERPRGVLRRSSSKFSNTMRSLRRRRSSAADHSEEESDAVFGVSLKRSIQVAKGIASTRHGNGGSSVRSPREYPLCVLRCAYYIRDCGINEPHIFGLDGDQPRVAQLREIFGAAETGYGKDLDWPQFSVHDAADLILLFLSGLPKPLISESAAKRWVSLSRQAAMGAARLDQGLDFWEEAFMGIHGPARPLFKLLLNLWGDIADAVSNEMTAERLASRIIRPLMHASAARNHTDLMLGLAFLIRKRSEYNLAVRGVTRQSNAAF